MYVSTCLVGILSEKQSQKIPYSSIIPWSIFVADGLSLLMILWDIFLLTSDPFCDKNYSNVASKIFWSQSMLDFFFVYHTTLTLTLAMLCCNGKVVRVVRPFLHCFSALANSVKKFFPFFLSSSFATKRKLTYAVSICAWFLKCQIGSLLQTRKKSISNQTWFFFQVRTWFLLPV